MANAINSQYPHLRPDEVEVWKRFLAAFPARFSSFNYDVRVGPGVKLEDGSSEPIKKMALGLSQKRIDVVAEGVEGLTLVEISPNAGAGSVGQLLVYQTLWVREHQNKPPPKLLLVTGFERSDIREVTADTGVELVVV